MGKLSSVVRESACISGERADFMLVAEWAAIQVMDVGGSDNQHWDSNILTISDSSNDEE